jgi:esterase/lipase
LNVRTPWMNARSTWVATIRNEVTGAGGHMLSDGWPIPRLIRRQRRRCASLFASGLFASGLLLLVAHMGGCSVEQTSAPAEFVSSGWANPSRLAPGSDFNAYVDGLTEELRAHRLPFNPDHSDAELAAVAPFRLLPGAHCQPGQRRGIAILVHGLSDTAFAMRDLAESLSAQCFESRVLLLPGHGTRSADLLVVDQNDWLHHVRSAVMQAALESDFVVITGFSLGAALALSVAAESPDRVDAVIGLSPAYRIRSGLLARQSRWIAAFRPWLDSGKREEFARYSAMPAKGIASTMATLSAMDIRIKDVGTVSVPWLVVQSEDDEVIDVARNRDFFRAAATDPRSALVNYYSDRPPDTAGTAFIWLPAQDDAFRVVGLSHLAVHIAPDNPHYGISGRYRNCGSPPFRTEEQVQACKRAERVWYGVGGQSPPAGEAGARATFNPHYAALERRIGEFLDAVERREGQALASK